MYGNLQWNNNSYENTQHSIYINFCLKPVKSYFKEKGLPFFPFFPSPACRCRTVELVSLSSCLSRSLQTFSRDHNVVDLTYYPFNLCQTWPAAVPFKFDRVWSIPYSNQNCTITGEGGVDIIDRLWECDYVREPLRWSHQGVVGWCRNTGVLWPQARIPTHRLR